MRADTPLARAWSWTLAAAALACAAASCRPAEAGVERQSPDAGAAPTARAAVIARLSRLNQSEQFLFGQENATIWGMYLDGELASTGKWYEKTARAGHFTADTEALVGDEPAVLGVSLDMLAFEPPEWNRRAPAAEAIRRHLAAGGLVTIDWHAPSCGATLGTASKLGTVEVDGRDVTLQAVTGGAFFYAEEEYRRPITSAADVPEALKCLCKIANDRLLDAGTYRGMTGKTWLTAHVRQAAQVFRDQGLSDLPIIMRPFHEQTGAWFWWGSPYWNCAALLESPGAISGPDAYKTVVRAFASAFRSEPGMSNLLFAYSPDRLLGPGEEERFGAAGNKVSDPTGRARDILRERIVRELRAAGLAYVSPTQQAARLRADRATSPKRAAEYVAQRRPFYAESYAGDDVFDVLGIDMYHPIARPAGPVDLRRFRLQLRVVAEEARARGKPWALTEAGTYRLQLLQLASQLPPGRPLLVHGRPAVDDALARLFDPADRAALLRHFGLAAPGPVSLTPAERALVVPKTTEDWFNDQLLVLAREAKVAYALVWQTYYDASWTDRYVYYYVPYPGHPTAQAFQRFHADPATCFLRDGCGR